MKTAAPNGEAYYYPEDKSHRTKEAVLWTEEQESSDDLIQHTTLNLKLLFPCAKQKAFRYTFPQFMVFLTVFLAAGAINFFYIRPRIASFEEQMEIRSLMLIPIAFAFTIWLGYFIYWKVGGMNLFYWIEQGEVRIKKGVFLKHSGHFPLRSITDVYLEQTTLDWIFKTYTAVISTPNNKSLKFARIPGLSEKSAHGIQKYLYARMSSVKEETDGLPHVKTKTSTNGVAAKENAPTIRH